MMKMIANPHRGAIVPLVINVIIIVVLIAVASNNQSAFAQQQQQQQQQGTTNQIYSEPTTTNFRESYPSENNQPTQLVDIPVILNNNNKLSPLTNNLSTTTTTTNSEQSMATSNFYSNSQAQKFRVNVSNICDQNQMHVTIRLSRPFYGLIHTKEKRKKAGCFIEGNGEQAYTLDISYTLIQSEQAYCGVTSSQYFTKYANQTTSHQQQQTLSVTLVVRLHKTIEFSDDRHFLLNCANRCSRPNCSSLPSQADSSFNAAESQSAFTRTGFVASESILSPILRASANELVQSQSTSRATNNLGNLINSPINTSCDLILELRFKWLIGICSFLAALLVISICIAGYLCNALNKSAPDSRGTSERRKSHSTNTLRKLQQQDEGKFLQVTVPQQVINSSSNQVQDHHQQQQQQQKQHEQLAMCWPLVVAADGRTTSGNSVATSGGTVVCSSQANDCLLDKIRDDNSYLAKQQHQQYIFSNNLVPIINHHNCINKPSTVADNRQVLGRAASSSITHNTIGGGQLPGSQDQRGRNLSAHIRRRRSFGADYSLPESNNNHHIELEQIGANSSQEQQQQGGGFEPTFSGARLDANQRAKSRSQTTIYYEQNQDPFKAVPFSYHLTNTTTTTTNNNNNNNSGYLSDTAAVLGAGGTDQQQIGYSTQQHLQQRHWPPNYQLSFMPPAPSRLVKLEDQQLVQQQHQPPTTSQFDPKNSSQLIELIQKKHRQQMEQANRTAATMQHQAHLWQAQKN